LYGTLLPRTMSRKNMGSSIDDFLMKENIFAEAQAQAIKEVVAWQLAKAMKKKKISKARMAIDAVLAVLNAAEWLFGGAPTS
jgi:cobalamin biosynthesis protein CobT